MFQEKKYAAILFCTFQAQSLPTIGHLHPEFCKVTFPLSSRQYVHILLKKGKVECSSGIFIIMWSALLVIVCRSS